MHAARWLNCVGSTASAKMKIKSSLACILFPSSILIILIYQLVMAESEWHQIMWPAARWFVLIDRHSLFALNKKVVAFRGKRVRGEREREGKVCDSGLDSSLIVDMCLLLHPCILEYREVDRGQLTDSFSLPLKKLTDSFVFFELRFFRFSRGNAWRFM
jgi:hypothetical protein